MRTTCFVTYELYPVTRGGCGALLHNLASQLLAAGDRVVFLLDVTEEVFDRFDQVERAKLPNAHNCVAYRVESLLGADIADAAQFICWYDWRAFVLHQAALRVHALQRPDLIEFFDFYGTAFYALSEKLALGAYEETRIAVRFHATIEAMDTVDLTNALHRDLYTLYSLERASLALADTVIVPSAGFYEESLLPLYPWLPGKESIAVPPLRKVLRREQVSPSANGVLFYGRLFAIKGVDLLVDSAISWMRQYPESQAEFYFLGGDSNQPPDGAYPYAEYLIRRIPQDLRGRFHFIGHVTHEQTEALLRDVRFAVFPNRYESFCYAAHEIYTAGVPMIVSDIPGFKDFFVHERNCLQFESGSSDALVSCMARLWNDAGLRQRLSYPYPVVLDEVAQIYRESPAAKTIAPESREAGILVLILTDSVHDAQLVSEVTTRAGCETLLLLRAASDATEPTVVLFGSNVRCVDPTGRDVDVHAVRTRQAVLVLRSSDRVDPSFLSAASAVLASRQKIAYVSSWMEQGGGPTAYALPLMLDVAPTSGRSPFTRSVMRTQSGRQLLDVFDAGMGEYAELKYLWDLTREHAMGLVIPRAWVHVVAEPDQYPSPKQFSYLLNGNFSLERKKRIAQYAVATWNMSSGQDSRRRRVLDNMSALPTPVILVLLFLGRSIAYTYRRSRSAWQGMRRRLNALGRGRNGPQRREEK
ncbi:glycosyltransferase family 4 protein [Achromobacter sp. AGC78]